MIIDCIQNEPDRQIWIWILIFLSFMGAIAYFFLCYLQRNNLPLPRYFNHWTHQRQLWNAEAAAQNIGKDHQYVELGKILYDMGTLERSASAYQTALEKNPQNLQALWGAAEVALGMKNFEGAKVHLEALLKIDPDYKYGEASRAYAKTLIAMQDLETAKERLEQNIRQWNNSEDRLLFAEIAIEQGDKEVARNHLQTMISNLRGGPMYHYRKNTHLIKKAERLLKKLKT